MEINLIGSLTAILLSSIFQTFSIIIYLKANVKSILSQQSNPLNEFYEHHTLKLNLTINWPTPSICQPNDISISTAGFSESSDIAECYDIVEHEIKFSLIAIANIESNLP